MTHAVADPLDLPLRGIACIVAGVSLLSIQDAAIKSLSGDYPVFEILFLRGLVAIALLAALAAFRGGLGLLSTRRPLIHLLRGSSEGVGCGMPRRLITPNRNKEN